MGSQQAEKKVLDGEASGDHEPIDGIAEKKDDDTRLGHRQARLFVVDDCHGTGRRASGIRSRSIKPTAPMGRGNFK
jgi:hypothetical protein